MRLYIKQVGDLQVGQKFWDPELPLDDDHAMVVAAHRAISETAYWGPSNLESGIIPKTTLVLVKGLRFEDLRNGDFFAFGASCTDCNVKIGPDRYLSVTGGYTRRWTELTNIGERAIIPLKATFEPK